MPQPKMIPEGAQQGVPGVQPEQVEGERAAAFAQSLGMHPDFVEDVRIRGQDAIIDRAEETDPTGALGKLLRLGQQLGTWMEERAATGRPPEGAELRKLVSKLAGQYGMEPEMAWELVSAALRTCAQTASQLGGGQNAPAT